MRVDFHYEPQPAPETRSPQNASAAAQSTSRLPDGEDQAQLSGAHVQVNALAAQASQLPEIREQRVQSLRQAVQSGQYQSDPQRLAGALVAHMLLAPAV